MTIFNRLSNTLHYWLDSFNAINTKTKIERFQFDQQSQEIIVVYRIGNKRLLDTLNIIKFEHIHFDSCANYDQHRLTKFSTLQNILQHLSSTKGDSKVNITNLIENEADNEQLF